GAPPEAPPPPQRRSQLPGNEVARHPPAARQRTQTAPIRMHLGIAQKSLEVVARQVDDLVVARKGCLEIVDAHLAAARLLLRHRLLLPMRIAPTCRPVVGDA